MTGHSGTRIIRIEWGHCDAAGIVYYPNYFSIFNESTLELFSSAGYAMRFLMREFGIMGIPMIETKANFKIPSSFGDIIEVRSRVTGWRRTSFFVAHEVYRENRLAIEASEHRVWACRDPDGNIRGTRAPTAVIERMCSGAPDAGP